ncbi:MAG: TRAP transporter large permease subunit [Spirochaetota bacterium]
MKKIVGIFRGVENGAAFTILILISVLCFGEVVLRKFFQTGIEGSTNIVTHLTFLIAFIGGMITSRENGHLSLSIGLEAMKNKLRTSTHIVGACLGATVTTAFALSSLSMTLIGFSDRTINFIPVQYFGFIMPIGFIVMAVRFITLLPAKPLGKTLASLGFLFGALLGFQSVTKIAEALLGTMPAWMASLDPVWLTSMQFFAIPMIVGLIVFAMLGTPIFIVLGGIGYILFAQSGGALEVVPNEAYTLLTSNSIPAIPLFAVVGYVLSQSKSGERLVRFFKAFFGWMPGGTAIVAVIVSAFFTTFTGASGITILALGGLLSYTMINSGKYKSEFATGFLTSSGSIGIIFPPSLAVIMYGSLAQVSVLDLFFAGIIPGILMIIVMSSAGVFESLKEKLKPEPFSIKEAILAFRDGFWDIMLPVFISVFYFTGTMSIVETGAFAVFYVLIVQLFVYRDIKLKALPGVVLKSVPVIGGILIIVALAKALSYFIVDARIPMMLADWVKTTIASPIVFLLLLNLALLVVGCFMDIFSAIIVVVPLIIPIAAAFNINPVHLGMIFIMNMELGFLTPPVGLNLFLGSYSFNKPLSQIIKNIVPFFILQLIAVLIITYVPWLSTFLPNLINGK